MYVRGSRSSFTSSIAIIRDLILSVTDDASAALEEPPQIWMQHLVLMYVFTQNEILYSLYLLGNKRAPSLLTMVKSIRLYSLLPSSTVLSVETKSSLTALMT